MYETKTFFGCPNTYFQKLHEFEQTNKLKLSFFIK